MKRRSFIKGLSLFVAAPAIIRVAQLMPVKVWAEEPIVGVYKHAQMGMSVIVNETDMGFEPLSEAAIERWAVEMRLVELMKRRDWFDSLRRTPDDIALAFA